MKKIIVLYDDWCPKCTKFINFVRKYDVFNLIEINQLRNPYHFRNYDSLDNILAEKQMASFDNQWNYGYPSVYKIFLRLPIMWISLPFFFFLLITNLGQYLYLQLAVKRKIIPLHCEGETCEMKLDKPQK